MGCPEAYRLGLVQEVTPPGKELDRAIDLAQKIAAAAPLGVRATLTSSCQALAADEATSLAALQAEFDRLLQSEDARSSSARCRKVAPRSIAACSGPRPARLWSRT